MPRQALSQRQREHRHEQGMLNVAFTRARDEIHVFHSAPIETFTKADGSPGALTRWLFHCHRVQTAARARPVDSRLGRVDSEFEAEVAHALREHRVMVLHQYPACGFFIDLVCDKDGVRVGVECDGEMYHTDEQGQPRLDDLEREAILRRAGWRLVRIPYRKWLRDPAGQVARVLEALARAAKEESEDEASPNAPGAASVIVGPAGGEPPAAAMTAPVSRTQAALLDAIRDGAMGEEELFYRVRDALHLRRLTARLRRTLTAEADALARRGLVAIEDHEYFLTPEGRAAGTRIVSDFSGSYGYRRRRYRRWRR